MLTKRIIPCLDVQNGRVVKGINFLSLKDAGSPVEQASAYSKEGADELVFLDIAASKENRKTRLDIIEKTAEQVFIPFTVGGGIQNLKDIKDILRAGADKVSINTAAVERPFLIKEASEEFGSQCIVAAIDAKRIIGPRESLTEAEKNKRNICSLTAESKWQVYIYGGSKAVNLDVLKWAVKVESLGAGEILLTSMDADGTKNGYDLELTRAVSEAVNIPVIASGGAGTWQHLYDALTKGKADAVLAASIFHYGQYSIKEVKQYLKNKAIAVRM